MTDAEQEAANELQVANLEETDGYAQLADNQALQIVRNLKWRIDGKVRSLMSED